MPDRPPEELVTLPQAPSPGQLAALLAAVAALAAPDSPQAALGVRQGQDAQGTPRTVITVAHPDPEVVAATRQAVLRACQQAGVRAFVV